MKKILIAAVICVALLAAYVWASPYKTVIAITDGLIDHDADSLSTHVDFPALRQGLKDQGNEFLPEDAPDSRRNLLSSVGKMIGSTVIHKIIDSAVTPEGMIVLVNEVAGLDERREELNSRWRRMLAPFLEARYGYDSLSTFSYWLPTEDGEIRFMLRRSRMRWKMVNAVIPPDLLKRRLARWMEG